MMTIRRLSVGSGYKYLLKSIAVGDGPEQSDTSDLVRYYRQSGTPAGRFLGAGLAGLDDGQGVEVGHVVTEQNLQRMLQACADPISGQTLGRTPGARSVGGFDLTFSPTKSVSVAWGLADRRTRNVIYHCHQEAIDMVLAYAEREVFKTRSGSRGCLEEDVRGIIAASFTHFDSRDADPQLHDHVVVWNRVQAASDGAWRTLDSRGLFASAVMLSEFHQGVLSDLLTKALGWDWEPHARRSSPVAKWEVAGVPESLMEEFSRRTADIVALKDALVSQFEVDHGRVPTDVEVLRLRQTATLATRRAKQGKSLSELTDDWRTRARPYLDDEPVAWVHELGRRVARSFRCDDFSDAVLRDLATASLDVVSAKRATFSRANIHAEVLRQLQSVRFAGPSERIEVARRTTDLALAEALLISTPGLLHTPRFLLRPDGSSKFEATGHWRYTTTTLLNAEARLLAACARPDAPVVSPRTLSSVTRLPLPGVTVRLSTDQTRCVTEIATSARSLDVLVGAAGTGKSTAMAGLRVAWEREHGPSSVIGLAPSAAAAEVLGEDMGIETDNLAKWLYEHRQRGRRQREILSLREQIRQRGLAGRPVTSSLRARITSLEADLQRWCLGRGQLVIVDEASLAATFDLDELVSAALDVGAKVLLVGDPAQLCSIGAGGMFRTLVRERGDAAQTLTDLRRFKSSWEKNATLGVRSGDPAALAAYENHGRVTEGTRNDLLDALYLAWQSDTDRGLRSLMLAGDAATVHELNTRARAHRLQRGAVDPGITISDLTVGVNDLVVTRQNDRRLRTTSGWVKNGDEWRVNATYEDGSLRVTRLKGTESIYLPARYVSQHVELAYASTVYRAQGRSADTSHAFISPTTTREVLYVAVTRGSAANHLYVDTNFDPDPETGHDGLTAGQSALDVLEGVLSREGADVSATDMIRSLQECSIASLVAQYETIVAMADGDRWEKVLRRAGLDGADMARAQESDAYRTLLSQLREAELRGFDARHDLATLVALRPFTDAEDIAATLTHRIDRYVTAMGYPEPNADQLIVGLFPRATGIADHDIAAALDDRVRAIEERARYLADFAIETGAAWVRDLGDAPEMHDEYLRWHAAICTSAAYRDQWGIMSQDTLVSTGAAVDVEGNTQLTRVITATRLADHIGTAHDPAKTFPSREVVDPTFEPTTLDYTTDF